MYPTILLWIIQCEWGFQNILDYLVIAIYFTAVWISQLDSGEIQNMVLWICDYCFTHNWQKPRGSRHRLSEAESYHINRLKQCNCNRLHPFIIIFLYFLYTLRHQQTPFFRFHMLQVYAGVDTNQVPMTSRYFHPQTTFHSLQHPSAQRCLSQHHYLNKWGHVNDGR